MEFSEACNELAEIVRSDKWLRISYGFPIQMFCDYLKNGETPAMALALTREDLEKEDEQPLMRNIMNNELKEKMTDCQKELPKYNCHKQVWALKTTSIIEDADGTTTLGFADKDYAPIKVPNDLISKYEPKVGWYYVIYKDGYKAFSPADVFEEGYTLA